MASTLSGAWRNTRIPDVPVFSCLQPQITEDAPFLFCTFFFQVPATHHLQFDLLDRLTSGLVAGSVDVPAAVTYLAARTGRPPVDAARLASYSTALLGIATVLAALVVPVLADWLGRRITLGVFFAVMVDFIRPAFGHVFYMKTHAVGWFMVGAFFLVVGGANFIVYSFWLPEQKGWCLWCPWPATARTCYWCDCGLKSRNLESFLHRQRETSDQQEKEFAPTLEIEWNAQAESDSLCDREN
jgi:hypothetical protein